MELGWGTHRYLYGSIGTARCQADQSKEARESIETESRRCTDSSQVVVNQVFAGSFPGAALTLTHVKSAIVAHNILHRSVVVPWHMIVFDA